MEETDLKWASASLLLLSSLFLLTHGLHGGEEQHVTDGGAVGEKW